MVLALTRAFPGAPLYTSLYEPATTFPEFAGAAVVVRIGLVDVVVLEGVVESAVVVAEVVRVERGANDVRASMESLDVPDNEAAPWVLCQRWATKYQERR